MGGLYRRHFRALELAGPDPPRAARALRRRPAQFPADCSGHLSFHQSLA